MEESSFSLKFNSKRNIIIGIFSILLLLYFLFLVFKTDQNQKVEQKTTNEVDTTKVLTRIDSLLTIERDLEEKIEILNRYLVSKNLEVIDFNSKNYYKKD